MKKQTVAKGVVLLLGLVLIGCLLYQSSLVRELVVSVAGNMGTAAVPFLRHAYQDEDNKVRQRAGTALRELGEDAVPPLTASLQDTSLDVRREAACALRVVAHKAQSAVPVLIETLTNERDKQIRRDVVTILGSLGGKAKDAIPALLSA